MVKKNLLYIMKEYNFRYISFFNHVDYCRKLDIVTTTEKGIELFEEALRKGDFYNLIFIDHGQKVESRTLKIENSLALAEYFRKQNSDCRLFLLPNGGCIHDKERMERSRITLLDEGFALKGYEDIFGIYPWK